MSENMLKAMPKLSEADKEIIEQALRSVGSPYCDLPLPRLELIPIEIVRQMLQQRCRWAKNMKQGEMYKQTSYVIRKINGGWAPTNTYVAPIQFDLVWVAYRNV